MESGFNRNSPIMELRSGSPTFLRSGSPTFIISLILILIFCSSVHMDGAYTNPNAVVAFNVRPTNEKVESPIKSININKSPSDSAICKIENVCKDDDIVCLQNSLAYLETKLYKTESNVIVLRIPLNSNRDKRFVGTLFTGITGFIIKSGIWSAFKVGCTEFLKYTGGVILGEIFDLLDLKRQYRPKRSSNIINYNYLQQNNNYFDEISRSNFSDGCKSIVNCDKISEAQRVVESVLVKHLPTVNRQSGNFDGMLNLNSSSMNVFMIRGGLRDNVTFAAGLNFQGGKYRDICFMSEVACLVPIEVTILEFRSGLVGCGVSPYISVKISYLIVNGTELGNYQCEDINLNFLFKTNVQIRNQHIQLNDKLINLRKDVSFAHGYAVNKIGINILQNPLQIINSLS